LKSANHRRLDEWSQQHLCALPLPTGQVTPQYLSSSTTSDMIVATVVLARDEQRWLSGAV
jgi:hypothetical protein